VPQSTSGCLGNEKNLKIYTSVFKGVFGTGRFNAEFSCNLKIKITMLRIMTPCNLVNTDRRTSHPVL
jgi:hypothetical protein